mmetsp:Transcript_37385/g.42938  ORF Transcript_37385/g.42938 Transcript_37385/m.42938 type:complete len:85 (+) Transcript_37385:60-314(+)
MYGVSKGIAVLLIVELIMQSLLVFAIYCNYSVIRRASLAKQRKEKIETIKQHRAYDSDNVGEPIQIELFGSSSNGIQIVSSNNT